MNTYQELVDAQMKEFPDSIIINVRDVMGWAGGNSKYNRYMSVAMSIYYPVVVWYRIPCNEAYTGQKEYRGFRYGTEEGEYASLTY